MVVRRACYEKEEVEEALDRTYEGRRPLLWPGLRLSFFVRSSRNRKSYKLLGLSSRIVEGQRQRSPPSKKRI
ncbi:hypothetical protein PI124_g21760 [Phytophthora idaei]|nr:hypothetical protein PI125_g23591 [Phytophthora idaei]KAG3127971.1 hypothetical protein PI126_g21612 [Phytophthora idaei]KAG3233162.1 hypothetical protein PI124_g21760 [Phytophthora idaei]